MNLRTAERMIRAMMNQHGLTDWKIGWTRAKKTHGLCCYGIKTLKFSAVAFATISEDDAYETVLHEIAHALAGHAAGHGPLWLTIYRQIGGKGGQFVSREASAAIAATAAWQAKCPNCGKGNSQHRAPLRVKACGSCSRVWKAENIYTWYKNGRKASLSEMPIRYQTEMRGIMNRRSLVSV